LGGGYWVRLLGAFTLAFPGYRIAAWATWRRQGGHEQSLGLKERKQKRDTRELPVPHVAELCEA
jgi:hypothetical protein